MKLFVTLFSIFSLLNQTLVVLSHRNTVCRGPALSDTFEFCQSSWCAEESYTDCKSKVIVLAAFGIHCRRTKAAQNRCSKWEWHHVSAKVRFPFAFRHFLDMGIYWNAYCYEWLGREISCYGGKKTNTETDKKGGRYIFRKKGKASHIFITKKVETSDRTWLLYSCSSRQRRERWDWTCPTLVSKSNPGAFSSTVRNRQIFLWG